jgi:glycosyltransferase involved in cell wall biosynthesis
MAKGKVCVVGPVEPYPAFHSLQSILNDTLGRNGKIELKRKGWTGICPSFLKIPLYVFEDIWLSLKLLRLFSRCRMAALLLFQNYLLFLPITSRLLGMRNILYVGGSGFKTSYQTNRSFISRFLAFSNIPVQRVCHRIANCVVIPSRNMVEWLELEDEVHKLRYALCVVDSDFFNTFRVVRAYSQRKNVIGYVGSLIESKGLLNLVDAVRLLERRLRDKDLQVLIIGSGSLFKCLKAKTRTPGLSSTLVLTGRKPHKALVEYYNSMKLLVLPSYTEGLPSVVLEAMACGTPVLATKVGAIPSLIQEGKTGFLLDSNHPTRIAKRVIELLSAPRLMEKTSSNARNYVVGNFGHEKAVNGWQLIFKELSVI